MAFRRLALRQGGRLLLCCGILLGACTPDVAPKVVPSPTSQPAEAVTVPAPFTASIDQAGPALIAAERAASIEQDRATLRLLWADDARIVDGRGSATPDDDYIWQGRAAILDRYALAVFPSPPPPLQDPTLAAATIQAEADSATLDHAGDHWRLVRRDGRWWLAELRYSTPD